MLVYLSGPMSNIPLRNYPAFRAEAARLRALRHHVFSPVEINEGREREGWAACMRRDIHAIATACDSMRMLPGRGTSRGARLEYSIAVALGMRIFGVDDKVPAP